MKRKKIFISCAVLVILALAGIGFLRTYVYPVERLEISPRSITMAPGESIQLTLKGYDKNGTPVSEEKMAKLSPQWECHMEVLAVNENGLLTAISDGVGNVWAWVETPDGKLGARAITVEVKS